MAARRKVFRSEPSGARAFAVVVEKMNADFQVFGEALAGLRSHVDRRLDEVDAHLERVEHGTQLVKAAVLEHGRELKELRVAVTDLATKKVDRDEVESIVEQVLARTHR